MSGNFDNEIMSAIREWLQRVSPGAGTPETEMMPMTMEQEFARRNWPITPIPNTTQSDIPRDTQIPNNDIAPERDLDRYTYEKNTPMQNLLETLRLRTPGMDI
jgi:hypothetical protein